ncbi:MAG: NAD-dependent deacylase [Chitinophagales bacterium]|nr:NAD-dependent deacylase [Chitinophagales bacterium]
MKKKKIIVLTGAGISAESGIATFRDAGGLWEGHDIMEVASPEGWRKNKALVLDFYNKRRAQLKTCVPNAAHLALVELEQAYDVHIITQNVDDLHERAGSKNVLHLHGELKKVRSTVDPNLIYDWDKDVNIGDVCEKGSQLRPHIVWFGEDVPLIGKAAELSAKADIFIIIGTSLVVYPAAGLVGYAHYSIPKIVIDNNKPILHNIDNVRFVIEPATIGVRNIVNQLLTE